MLSTTQTFFRHIAALTIFFLSVAFHALQGQVLTGPSSVQPGSTHTYYFNDGSTYSPAEWLISGGSQVGSSNHGSQFNVTITWGSAGSGMVTFKSGMYLLGGMAVTIGSPVPVAPLCRPSRTTPVLPDLPGASPQRARSITGRIRPRAPAHQTLPPMWTEYRARPIT